MCAILPTPTFKTLHLLFIFIYYDLDFRNQVIYFVIKF